MLSAVTGNGLLLEKYPEFNDNLSIVLAALKQNYKALRFVCCDIKAFACIIMRVVMQDDRAFDLHTRTLLDSDSFANAVLRQEPLALERLSSRLRGCKRVVFAAVTFNAEAVKFASKRLRNNSKFKDQWLRHQACIMLECLYTLLSPYFERIPPTSRHCTATHKLEFVRAGFMLAHKLFGRFSPLSFDNEGQEGLPVFLQGALREVAWSLIMEATRKGEHSTWKWDDFFLWDVECSRMLDALVDAFLEAGKQTPVSCDHTRGAAVGERLSP